MKKMLLVSLSMITLAACSSRTQQTNEVENMVGDVLKADQGFTMEIDPHPKLK